MSDASRRVAVDLPVALEEELDRVLAADPDSQFAELDRLCGSHPAHAPSIRARFADCQTLVRHLDGLGESLGGPPQTIGPYRVLDALGEGAMGDVYLAEQREPVVHRVAIKVMKLGMDSRRFLARFNAERQALALMEHDYIAKVLNAGATDRGRPYLVMEYVKGVPLTEYCDAQRLSVRERVQLIRQVCAGVQHAHQKGVIHRDLKPSNILVTVQGDQAVPKIIDFGLARAADHRLARGTLLTEEGHWIGTLPYMSPEQAGTTRLDIDTRADVYALGVLLYELLTGDLPLRPDDPSDFDRVEMARRIREEEPAKPSSRVAHLGQGAPGNATASALATKRRCTPQALQRQLRGDLNWITLKALEKDRTRRFESADALAAALGHYLRDEPVGVGPPARWGRVVKFVRRNRTGVIAAGLLAATVVTGGVGMTVIAADRARVLRDYRNLTIGGKLDELASRAAAAHPPWPDQTSELGELVATAEELVAQRTTLETAIAGLRRGHQGPEGTTRPPRRGAYGESARRAKLAQLVQKLDFELAEYAGELPAAVLRAERAERDRIADVEAALRVRAAESARVERPDADLQFLHDRLENLLGRLRVVHGELLPDLRWRLDWSRRIRAESVDAYRDAWAQARREVEQTPAYRGLTLAPQIGLVPLGADPDSGLQEFAHRASGTVPTRGAGSRLELNQEHGIVFVLLPPGVVHFGRGKSSDPTRPPPHGRYDALEIEAVLMAKHELSRAQWARLARGRSGLQLRETAADLRNRSGKQLAKPMNVVSWFAAVRLLDEYGLTLPREAEWEYACKAGRETRWHYGDDTVTLQDAANVRFDGMGSRRPLLPVFAPLRPNAFGLLHMHGNVWEWCRDLRGEPTGDHRALRGGSWQRPPGVAETTYRNSATPDVVVREYGLRAARALRPESR
ncbi:MAG: bifunctional serine/threonine-protein kinase/formylglycine-generating enzyme family protein [Planctomycetota bacterium]